MCTILPIPACGMIATLQASCAVAPQPQPPETSTFRYVDSHGKPRTNKPFSRSLRSGALVAGALLSSVWLSAIGFERS